VNDIDADVRVSGVFYKYREIPSETETTRWQWLEDTLVRRKVYFASPSTLNDPFDCYPRIDLTGNEQVLRARTADLLSDVYSARGQAITDRIRRGAEFQEAITEQITALRDDEFRNKTLYDVIDKSTGVYCMSRSARSVLQWSYYGGGHTGFCMEFNVPIDARPPFDQVVAMEYVTDREGVDLFDVIGGSNRNHVWKMVRKKFGHWSHEEEVRAFMPSAGVYELEADVLTGILFGLKAPERQKQRVRDLASSGWPNAKFYQSRQSYAHYAIELDEIR
jgi:hypothetical protein